MKWNGNYYEKTTLSHLGLVWYLSHDGKPCPYVYEGTGIQEMTILDINGFHKVSVGYCQCSRGPDMPEQLLLAKVFPATLLRPQTVFSIRSLKLFHMLHLTAHTNVWDFIAMMHRQTDCLDIKSLHATYQQFNFVQRQWRIIRAWRCSGRTTLENPKSAISLAIPCVSCPIPNVNLPSNWDIHPDRCQGTPPDFRPEPFRPELSLASSTLWK
ncbi:hypothetical protein M422DRAFT_186825 [Sphaerobolus stellatus SS14]|uniref:CxC2-like cysteine cluster KDZ transposase-associated domain-containing protein n=1 Tax=Sphaerobolus stellatus (strain SS14) TaxID=990650 RepID=A0A0C9UZ20_SPHS4|nr:hypothetical protein M422DRAFT_186825 [Sphaerobolus stellatus SS14]